MFILPPIIFAAGYTLSRKNFVTNISIILSLGIFGTIIAMGIISLIMSIGNEHLKQKSYDYPDISTNECFLLAAVLCSTDTVAVLTLITADKYRNLNSVLFGEGVINDAVAILLFRAVGDVI